MRFITKLSTGAAALGIALYTLTPLALTTDISGNGAFSTMIVDKSNTQTTR